MSASSTSESSGTMDDHSLHIDWTYVVPPANSVRIVIQQRRDGPFHKDAERGRGHYYIGVERYNGDTWRHVPGSSGGGFHSFEEAHRAAAARWAIAFERGAE